MDTLERRWARLWPHVVQFGPSDEMARPAVLLFHGCGGVRDHLRRYAGVAARAGYRAFLIDSYGPRGWSNSFASHLVCSGLMLRGHERSGDVLAAAWGVAQLPGVDGGQLALAGWSHGSWAVMDLMTLPLTQAGEAGIANPAPGPLDAVRAAFLAYPYVNLFARSRSAPWLRSPKVFGIVPQRDHLASIRTHMRAYASAVAGGSEVHIWPVDATHAFDEPGLRVPEHLMRYEPDLSEASLERFRGFLTETL